MEEISRDGRAKKYSNKSSRDNNGWDASLHILEELIKNKKTEVVNKRHQRLGNKAFSMKSTQCILYKYKKQLKK